MAAARVLVTFQSTVARNVGPLNTVVMSLCTVNGDVAIIQIPSSANLQGTFRPPKEKIIQVMETGIRPIIIGTALSFGTTADVEIARGAPATVNTLVEGELASSAATDAALSVRTHMAPSTAGEDFGWYLHERPGAPDWFGTGSAAPGEDDPGYDFNDAVLPTAAGWIAAVSHRTLSE